MKKFDLDGNFHELFGKNARVVSTNGDVYEGNIFVVFRSDENESGEQSIAIMLDDEGRNIELERPEIVSIEILE